MDGKFFSCGGRRFPFHGVSYGTFEPRAADAAQFPETGIIRRDFEAMAAAGFTVVRTYTAPPDDLLEAAVASGLKVLAGVYYDDWRYLIGAGRRQQSAMARDAAAKISATAERLAGREEVAAVVVGNEVPADAIRWFGARRVSSTLSQLVEAVHDADERLLVTYANYPTSEYLDVEGVDFLTYNIFLEDRDELRRYLTRLHHLAGDRPLVLGEIGIHVGDDDGAESRQADVLEWQLETALERGVAGTTLFTWTDDWWVGGAQVEGWKFGLTRADRSPRPAIDVASRWNRRTVADLDHPWPHISVAICAYNAAETLDECLRETSRLRYPNLEILVVDDGSTDATAGIAYRHPKVKLVSIEHGGLSVARNACISAASGDLIAFLDADAYPTPEWPYYLALGLDGPRVGGVGGPNVPPPDDAPGAHRVAASPGGPVHVLLTDDRAEHVPGCNMAFWRNVLIEVGGFDPVYTSAGDDVDVCWKVLDRGWEIGFHPAALVWHHRRPTMKAYLRQQRGYGKAEALVAARHPDRYTGAGTARWKGRIYSSTAQSLRRPRIYRGAFAAAAYQSVYGAGGHLIDLAHQVGIPAALMTAVVALLVAILAWPPALVVTAAALVFVLALGAYDGVSATPPRHLRSSRSFHGGVAVLHVLQPMARWWGRWRHRFLAHHDLPVAGNPPPVARRSGRKVLVVDCSGTRAELITEIVARLRRERVIVHSVTGWEDHDGRIPGSVLIHGQLISSAHAEGVVQLRTRPRLRWAFVALAVAGTATLWWISPVAGVMASGLVALDVGVGAYRVGPRVRSILRRQA